MAKLSRVQASHHAKACEFLEKERLSFEEKCFVLEHWREDARHINSVAGAFFTPIGLARDFAIQVAGRCVIDLCAGIGALAFAIWQYHDFDRSQLGQMTCVEINPDYIAVGKKILPAATWIQADVLRLPEGIGHFDCAVGNPPFGTTKASSRSPRYTGRMFEYRVIDIASDISDHGVFIVPQTSAPFEYSGKQCYRWTGHERYREFSLQTSITLGPNCGIDTSAYRNNWRGVAPTVEIVTADFQEARETRAVAAQAGPPPKSAHAENEFPKKDRIETDLPFEATHQLDLF